MTAIRVAAMAAKVTASTELTPKSRPLNTRVRANAPMAPRAVPASASVGATATKAKLDVLSGALFDASYIKSQLKAHRRAVALFKKESTMGQDPDAKAFAAATLPTLRGHLKQITSIATSAGVSTK